MVKGTDIKAFISRLGFWLLWTAILLTGAAVFYAPLSVFLSLCNYCDITTEARSLSQNVMLFLIFMIIWLTVGVVQWIILLIKGVKLSALWILATGGGALAGLLIGMILPYINGFANNFEIQLAITGLTMGVAQWLVIRRRVPNSYGWIIATAFGWSFAMFSRGLSQIIGLSSFQVTAIVVGAMVISTTAVLLFNQATQRRFNMVILGGFTAVILIAGVINSKIINYQIIYEKPISTLTTLHGIEHEIASVAFSPDSKLVAASGGGKHPGTNITVWETASGKESFSDTTKYLSHNITFSNDSALLAAQYDSSIIRLWDTASGSIRRSFVTTLNFAEVFDFSPNEQGLAVGDTLIHGALAFGDPISGSIQYTPEDIKSFDVIRSIAFNPAGELMVARQEKVEWWDMSAAKKIREMTGLNYSAIISHYAFSPDGRYLVQVGGRTLITAFAKTAYIWDLSKGKVVQKFLVWDVKSVAFSSDSSTLAFGRTAEQGILLWDVVRGRRLKVLRGGEDKTAVAFSPDGKLLATGSVDGEVMLWEMPTRDE